MPGSLSTGVYYAYSAAANEPSNPITEPLSNDRLWVHPSIVSGAQTKPNGEPDNRLTTKVSDAGRTRNLNDLIGTHKPILYNSASNPASAKSRFLALRVRKMPSCCVWSTPSSAAAA